MKDRRLLRGLRSVAVSLDTGDSEKADSFSLLQSIAAHCGLRLSDDGLVATCKQLKRQDSTFLVSGCARSLSCVAPELLTAMLTDRMCCCSQTRNGSVRQVTGHKTMLPFLFTCQLAINSSPMWNRSRQARIDA